MNDFCLYKYKVACIKTNSNYVSDNKDMLFINLTLKYIITLIFHIFLETNQKNDMLNIMIDWFI